MKHGKGEKGVQTAVIVAAGLGTRLHDGSRPPKPLLVLNGTPLIGRVMESAARAGIRRFVVVTGYQAERMKRELPRLVPPECELELIHNPNFEEPNGVSLLLAAKQVKEAFALLMSDHIFSPERLRLALDHFTEKRRSLLVIESKETFDGDIEDATLVAVSQEHITAIGKELTEYDAVDTGMFVLNPEEICSALIKAGNAPGISDGMRVLIDTGRLSALNIEKGFWQDIDTPEDIEAGEKKIRDWQKTS